MFCEKLLCAGFGGQGVMSMGQLLAYAGQRKLSEQSIDLNALVAEVVERLVGRGVEPGVYCSANIAGGDAVNADHLRRARR